MTRMSLEDRRKIAASKKHRSITLSNIGFIVILCVASVLLVVALGATMYFTGYTFHKGWIDAEERKDK